MAVTTGGAPGIERVVARDAAAPHKAQDGPPENDPAPDVSSDEGRNF